MNTIMSARNISKNFGAVRALQNVDFEINTNEIVGLVGDNGAGKSTLIKVLSGVYEPNEGEIYLLNRRIKLNSPIESRKLGIEVIYQDMALVEFLEIWENIFLGRLLRKRVWKVFNVIDKKEMKNKSEQLLRRLGIRGLSATLAVSSLSGGQKKTVAISRSIYWNARVIFMDEPTAALGVIEVKKTLELIKTLKKTGISVVFISHNLQEIFSTVDRIVVLCRGRVSGVRDINETDEGEIIGLIMGGNS